MLMAAAIPMNATPILRKVSSRTFHGLSLRSHRSARAPLPGGTSYGRVMPGPLARFAPAFVLASRCQAADRAIAKALGIGRASIYRVG